MRTVTSTQTLRTVIERAIAKQHPVTISYVTASGRNVVRTVEPYRISVSAAGDVLVKTMDRESGDYRRFRLDRITHYTVHRTYFSIKNPTHLTEVVLSVDSGVPATAAEKMTMIREAVLFTIKHSNGNPADVDIDGTVGLLAAETGEITPSRIWEAIRMNKTPEYRTSNGVAIRAGLRVLDYDRKTGSVGHAQFTRGGSCDPGGEYFNGWFEVVRDDGSTALFNGERLRAL